MKFYRLVIALAAFSHLCFGQTSSSSPTAPNDDQPVKVNTYLVNVPVIASDAQGRNIAGLTRDNFTIRQDGEKRPIEFFADQQSPMNVAILIDASYSTRSLLADIKDAARDFLKVMRPEDQSLVASFDFKTRILSEFSADRKQLGKAVDNVMISLAPGSDMQDAIDELLANRFSAVKGRKAIIVLTDGEVSGKISDEKLLSQLAESDVLVYPIVFTGESTFLPFGFNGNRIGIERTIAFMNRYAADTGGKLYRQKSNNFKKIFQDIADELKYQYIVGFYPQNLDDGKTHQIGVEVNPPTIVVRTKRRFQLKAGN